MNTSDIEHDAALIAEIAAHPLRAAHAVGALMKHLPELIAQTQRLMGDRDAATKRAEAAEKERDALKAQIAADEQSAADALVQVSGEADREEGVDPAVTAIASTTGADASHVEAALDAHSTATANGATPDDVKAAAVKAATDAGATDVQAQAVAAAIVTATAPASTLPHPDAVATGDLTQAGAPQGKTILADGTQV